MADDRSLKAVFDGLAGRPDADPQELLGAHGDLPGDLLTAALGSYAETAPAEVAEHLAPFLADGGDPAVGLELLAAAPVVDATTEVELDGGAGLPYHPADDPADDLADDPHGGLVDGAQSFDGLDAADLLDAGHDGHDGHDGPGVSAHALDDGLFAPAGDSFGDHADDPALPVQDDGSDLDGTDAGDVPGLDVPALEMPALEDASTGLDEATDEAHDPYLQPADDLDDLFGSDPDDADDLDGLDG